MLAEALGADRREPQVGDERELRAGALERSRAHVLGAGVAALEEVLGLLGERAVGVPGARVREQRGEGGEGQRLVQIPDDGVGAPDARELRRERGAERGRAAVRGVDVEPQALARTDVGDRLERVEGAGRASCRRSPRPRSDAVRGVRAAAISARSASGRMRKRSSLSTAIAPPAPKPMICAARAVE